MIKGQTDLFVRKVTLMKSASLFRLDDHERYGDQQSVFFFFFSLGIATLFPLWLRS